MTHPVAAAAAPYAVPIRALLPAAWLGASVLLGACGSSQAVVDGGGATPMPTDPDAERLPPVVRCAPAPGSLEVVRADCTETRA